MAGASQKKINAQNQKILQNHVMITIAVYAVYLLYRVYWKWSTFTFLPITLLLITSAMYFFMLKQLKSQATPYTDERGNLHTTIDLSNVSGSLTEYMFDVIYVQWLCHVVGLFTEYIWLLYLVIPGFAIYKLVNFAMPMLKGGGAGAFQSMADQSQAFMSPQDRKKLEKKQRQDDAMQKRMKNMRM